MRVLIPGGIGVWSVGFFEGRKTEEPGEKTLGRSREPITNTTHIWQRVRIEPGPHWRKASVPFTVPSSFHQTL